ncbi:MAG: serine/threonine-protein kinase [Polyangiaceae bacterium]
MTSRDSQTDETTGYEVLAPLASGTYGENLLAVRRDPLGLGKLVVLRQLRRGLSADAQVRQTFVEMSRRAVRLSHHNLLQTYEIGERGGALYAVTEYLEGEPLDAIMAAVAPAPKAVDPRFWLLIACDVLLGLHYAHELRDFDGSELSLVHGGITPRKIFVTYSGRVVVTDFGLAALAAHAKRVEGTFLPEMVSYAAPEQREGRPCDPRADVYAVGLVLWELLSGRRHRQSPDPDAELEALPELREIKPDLDPKLAEAVMRAVERDESARFGNAAEFRAALEPFLERGGTVRRSALGDAIGMLFQKTRDKIPSLLAKRTTPLAPQDAYAVTLAGAPRSTSKAPEGEEEEAPFLLASPIEAVSDANVISVTELVSDSELLSSVELIGSGAGAVAQADDDDGETTDAAAASGAEEEAPDSAMPVSLRDVEIPVDETSVKSVGSIEAASPAKSEGERGPDSGERPTVTDPPAATAATDASKSEPASAMAATEEEREPSSEDEPAPPQRSQINAAADDEPIERDVDAPPPEKT